MTTQISDKVAQKLDNLPDKPGCYQMLDKKGKVIYVGKALVLRNRVRSYFHASAQRDAKTSRLVAEIDDLTWWVTSTELEALILENELIKRYKPHYNIKLKDDRQFPYIKVHWQDDFPKVSVVRRMQKDGARYFGPYSSSRACYQTMDALRRVFPYLDCDREITGNDDRPCLYYHIKLCGGPCIAKQSQAEYRKTLQQMMNFLQGDSDNVLAQMEGQMEQAAENLQFELAALYRDRIKSAQRIVEQQKIISAAMEDADYIAVAQDPRTADAAVQVFTVRNGRLIGRENYILEGATLVENGVADENSSAPAESSAADERQLGMLIGEFIQQFYDNAVFVPKLILVQALPHNSELTEDSLGEISSDSSVEVLEDWLSEKRGSKVELRVPRRGAKRDFMEMARRNATEYLRVQQALWAADTNRQTQAVTELQEALGLANPPSRIECFDVSTFQGTNTVGSMVVFGKERAAQRRIQALQDSRQGRARRTGRFRQHERDAASPLPRAVEDDESANPGKKGQSSNESWRILPDLVIIDGGKGQLGIAVEVLQEFDLLDKVPIVGLAKREEEIFRPGESQPLWLKRGSGALHLVQRVRDEAHRFAITYHRNLRSKEQIRSKLDDIPGIGPSRRKALLKHYGGDLDKIRNASIEELSALDGISRKVAETIKERL
ncbi:MAG: excinuclease ABC subunit UvrC [Caldilineaceae bacterium]